MFTRVLLVLGFALLSVAATCATEPPVVLPLPSEDVRAVLGPGDVLDIRVFGEKELGGVHQVSFDGTVRLPLVGSIEVRGLSPDEAVDRIAAAYNAQYLHNAQVTVFVKAFNSRKVYVIGQVAKPGPYTYEEGMTLIAALARAGGASRLADPNRAVITREVDGETVRAKIRAGDISRGQAADIPVRPGDIIFIPESLF